MGKARHERPLKRTLRKTTRCEQNHSALRCPEKESLARLLVSMEYHRSVRRTAPHGLESHATLLPLPRIKRPACNHGIRHVYPGHFLSETHMTKTLLLAALSLPVILLAPVRAADAPAPGKQEAQTFEKELAVKLDYLLYLPADYQKDQDKQWPLIIFLHGSGERGSDVQKVTKHGPPKYLAAGTDLPVKQFIVVSPQCPQAHQ